MNRLLVLLFAMTACQTPPKEEPTTIPFIVHKPNNSNQDIQQLKDDVRQLQYFIDHDKCFISYAVCLGEEKKSKQQCWDTHEACVISVYRQYKGIK